MTLLAKEYEESKRASHYDMISRINLEEAEKGHLNERMRGVIYRLAYEDGHSDGYHSVEYHYRKYIEFYREVRECEE